MADAGYRMTYKGALLTRRGMAGHWQLYTYAPYNDHSGLRVRLWIRIT